MKTITEQINSMGFYIRDMHNDGFTQFGAKKKLYEIKWAVENQLHNSPTFAGETEWLKEQEATNDKK